MDSIVDCESNVTSSNTEDILNEEESILQDEPILQDKNLFKISDLITNKVFMFSYTYLSLKLLKLFSYLFFKSNNTYSWKLS